MGSRSSKGAQQEDRAAITTARQKFAAHTLYLYTSTVVRCCPGSLPPAFYGKLRHQLFTFLMGPGLGEEARLCIYSALLLVTGGAGARVVSVAAGGPEAVGISEDEEVFFSGVPRGEGAPGGNSTAIVVHSSNPPAGRESRNGAVAGDSEPTTPLLMALLRDAHDAAGSSSAMSISALTLLNSMLQSKIVSETCLDLLQSSPTAWGYLTAILRTAVRVGAPASSSARTPADQSGGSSSYPFLITVEIFLKKLLCGAASLSARRRFGLALYEGGLLREFLESATTGLFSQKMISVKIPVGEVVETPFGHFAGDGDEEMGDDAATRRWGTRRRGDGAPPGREVKAGMMPSFNLPSRRRVNTGRAAAVPPGDRFGEQSSSSDIMDGGMNHGMMNYALTHSVQADPEVVRAIYSIISALLNVLCEVGGTVRKAKSENDF